MKIGLINPFYEYVENKQINFFPFGIAYIANYVMQKGHDAEILDLNATYLNKQELISVLRAMNCDIFGIGSLSGGYTYVKNLVALIKQYVGVPVIVGGPLAAHSAEIVLKNTGVDICVTGMGEYTTFGIIENLNNLERVKGLVYKDKNGEIIKTEPASRLPLSEIPRPAYHIVNMEDYIWRGATEDYDSKRRFRRGMRIMQMITGRGCPMGCKFCSRMMGRNFMLRPVDDIIEEIKFFIKTYKINGVTFRDELFLTHKERAYELATKLKQLNIMWFGQARVDRVDYDLIKHMKKCGCKSLGFGIESGSAKMLRLMNKGQTVEQIELAVKSCQKLDMDMKVQLVVGYPGEDDETINETVELFKRLGHPGRRAHLITPLPGSDLYDEVLKNGVIKNEEEYLKALSRRDGGFSKELPLINLTGFSDEELYRKKLDMEKRILKNRGEYLFKHPVVGLKYLWDKVMYNIDYGRYFSNPHLLVRRLLQKVGLIDNSKEEEAAKERVKQLRLKRLEYLTIN